MSIRVPNLAVLLMSLGIGILAICLKNAAVAAICFSIAAFYTALVLWLWRRQRRKR
jgi:heme A synthase